MWVGLAPVVVKNYANDTGALIVGSIGIGLALASLAWQAWTFLRSGSRAKLEFQRGLFRPSTPGFPSMLHKVMPGDTKPFQWEGGDAGGNQEVLIVTVRNVGRLPTTVTSITVTTGRLGLIAQTPPNILATAPLPYRLEAESEQHWLFPSEALYGLAVVPEDVGSSGPPWRLSAVKGSSGFQGGDPDESAR